MPVDGRIFDICSNLMSGEICHFCNLLPTVEVKLTNETVDNRKRTIVISSANLLSFGKISRTTLLLLP